MRSVPMASLILFPSLYLLSFIYFKFKLKNNDFQSLSTKFCDLSISKMNLPDARSINIFLSCRKATFIDALCTTLTLTLYMYAIDFIWPMLSISKISKKIYWLHCACVSFFFAVVTVTVSVSGVLSYLTFASTKILMQKKCWAPNVYVRLYVCV